MQGLYPQQLYQISSLRLDYITENDVCTSLQVMCHVHVGDYMYISVPFVYARQVGSPVLFTVQVFFYVHDKP